MYQEVVLQSTESITKLGGGTQIFSPLFGEGEPILTSIFFRWVGNHQSVKLLYFGSRKWTTVTSFFVEYPRRVLRTGQKVLLETRKISRPSPHVEAAWHPLRSFSTREMPLGETQRFFKCWNGMYTFRIYTYYPLGIGTRIIKPFCLRIPLTINQAGSHLWFPLMDNPLNIFLSWFFTNLRPPNNPMNVIMKEGITPA